MAAKKAPAPVEVRLSKPIVVKILPEEKRAETPPRFAKAAAVLSIFLLLLSLMTMGLFVLDTAVEDFSFDRSVLPAAVTVAWPRWASVHDPFTVRVVLHNQGAGNLNGFMDLVFEPANALSLEAGGTTSAQVVELAPGASQTQVFTFTPLAGQAFAPLSFPIQWKIVLRDGTNTVETGSGSISVLNIPRLQTLLAWLLGGSGLTAALTGLFWEQVKRGFVS